MWAGPGPGYPATFSPRLLRPSLIGPFPSIPLPSSSPLFPVFSFPASSPPPLSSPPLTQPVSTQSSPPSFVALPLPKTLTFHSQSKGSSFSGTLLTTRCTSTLSDGNRCPVVTRLHAPLCIDHICADLKLDISPSKIPGAGRGLFTLVDRAVGDHLVDYVGE